MKGMFLEKKGVLVTGGAGFIGSHLVKKLLDLDARVAILIIPGFDLWRIQEIRDKIKIIESNFQNLEELETKIDDFAPEIVFNLMANTDVTRGFENVEPMIKNNFLTVLDLIKILKDKEYLKSFINIGTCEEYGDGPVPFLESNREIPVSPYSLSKVLCTYLANYLGKIEGFPIITLRPFLTYGKKQTNEQLIPYLISNLIRGQKVNVTKMEQTRDFVYVEDLIEAIIAAPFKNIPYGEIINLSSGKEIQIREIAEIICRLVGREFSQYIETDLPYRKGETMHFYGSNQKAKEILDWEPKTSIEKGLTETVEWYKNYLKNKEETDFKK